MVHSISPSIDELYQNERGRPWSTFSNHFWLSRICKHASYQKGILREVGDVDVTCRCSQNPGVYSAYRCCLNGSSSIGPLLPSEAPLLAYVSLLGRWV